MNKTFALAVLFLWAASAFADPFVIACGEGSSSEALVPLIQAVYEELGIAVRFERLPPERALRDTNAGLYDGDIARASCTAELYPNLVLSHVPILTIELHAWTLTGSALALASPSNLAGLRVGYVRGLKLAEVFCAREGIEGLELNSFQSAVKMLKAGRIDVILSVCPSYCDELREAASPLPLVLGTSESFHVFHRSHEGLIAAFDDTLKRMKRDGRFELLTGGR